jgi:hypothetical protein
VLAFFPVHCSREISLSVYTRKRLKNCWQENKWRVLLGSHRRWSTQRAVEPSSGAQDRAGKGGKGGSQLEKGSGWCCSISFSFKTQEQQKEKRVAGECSEIRGVLLRQIAPPQFHAAYGSKKSSLRGDERGACRSKKHIGVKGLQCVKRGVQRPLYDQKIL